MLADLLAAGYSAIETFSFDIATVYSHEDWRGRIRASAGVAASLEPARRVDALDADLKRLLEERFATDPLAVSHRVFAVVAVNGSK